MGNKSSKNGQPEENPQPKKGSLLNYFFKPNTSSQVEVNRKSIAPPGPLNVKPAGSPEIQLGTNVKPAVPPLAQPPVAGLRPNGTVGGSRKKKMKRVKRNKTNKYKKYKK